jgi:hypothetical protein
MKKGIEWHIQARKIWIEDKSHMRKLFIDSDKIPKDYKP